MFCKQCGNEMQDGLKFCGSCGANQESGASAAQPVQTAYRAPNYEFKTVRCYPSDSAEDKYRRFYEDCGWTILDMDRKQKFDGQTTASDGSRTSHYSTQTHIKLQRDKNRPNYDKIKELSDIAENYFDTTPNTKKSNKAFLAPLIIGAVLLLLGIINRMSVFLLIAGAVLVGGGIALAVVLVKKCKKTNAAITERYTKNKAEADAARAECKRLVNQA